MISSTAGRQLADDKEAKRFQQDVIDNLFCTTANANATEAAGGGGGSGDGGDDDVAAAAAAVAS